VTDGDRVPEHGVRATPEGFLVIDKPAGCTSHDVVGTVRRALRERRVGHGGTLDPDATGVLLVAVGPTTRLLRYVTDLEKEYTAEVVLGTATDTLDASGTVTARVEMEGIDLEDMRAAARSLTGAIAQIPPMVSAIRVGGRRLYELARSGEEIERTPRNVTVRRLDVTATEERGVFGIEVACSSGTYVRTIAADLGTALGGVAHLRNLVRTRIGPFTLDRAVPPDRVSRDDLLPPLGLLAHLDRTEVDPECAEMVCHGRVLDRDLLGVAGDGPWTITHAGTLIAVYEAHGAGRAKPALVYAPQGVPVPSAGAGGSTGGS
jgi:tRNA pseudouridine55 synthase